MIAIETEMSEEEIAKFVHTLEKSKNQKLKAMAKERLRKANCMMCKRMVGGSFETVSGSVVCCSCYYEIGGDHG